MAIIRDGSFTVTTGGVAQNLILGFVPTRFTMWNYSEIDNPPVAQIVQAQWMLGMQNGEAWTWTSTVATGALSIQYVGTNGFAPYFPASNATLYPLSNLAITGISQAAQAVVTAVNSFTANDYGVTTVTFHNVPGMIQINTLSGVVQSSTAANFVVNINTSGFTAYAGPGGIANIITGIPALQGGLLTSGNAPGFPPAQTNTTQVLNTPLYNTATLGLTIGSALIANTSDVWLYEAVLDASFTSD